MCSSTQFIHCMAKKTDAIHLCKFSIEIKVFFLEYYGIMVFCINKTKCLQINFSPK